MAIYLALIAYVLFVPSFVSSTNNTPEQRHNKITFWSVLGIFFVLALKKYTVGIDIPGYKYQYELSASKEWLDFEYVYFEDGYILLQKFFSKIGFSFQWFTVFVYSIICYALYLFVKRFSKSPTVSLLFFICYQFFLFDITGLRQAIATGLCMIAFVSIDMAVANSYKKRKFVICGLLLLFIATQIHRSSFVFLLSLFLVIINPKKKPAFSFYYLSLPFAYLLQPFALNIIRKLFSSSGEEQFEIGLNFALLFFMGLILIYAYHVIKSKVANPSYFDYKPSDEDFRRQLLVTRVSLFALPIYLLLTGTEYMRGTMYFTCFFLVSLPTAFEYFEKGNRSFVKAAFVVFLIFFFYYDTLLPSTFNICPYEFFWE